MTEHTHDHVNGSESEEQTRPQVTLPPAEVFIQQQRDKISQLMVQNFELESAAMFQAELAQGFQEQMVRLSSELSELKGEKENQPQATENRATKRAAARKK